mmetsp:Transcript_123936/g.264286  ORF Transcript_123936/g.264286 Transcript_123936/m.264286 type:complete len:290 (+) Transcript_123936:78-947(+)
MAVYFDAPNGQPLWQVSPQQMQQQISQLQPQVMDRQAWYQYHQPWESQDDFEYNDCYSEYGDFTSFGAGGSSASWSAWETKSSQQLGWTAPSNFGDLPEEPPAVHVVNSTSSGAYASLCKDAETADLVALDAEWVPDWNVYSDNPISVLQLAFPSSRRVYVLQLGPLARTLSQGLKLPQAVQMMLVNPQVTKVGFAVSSKDAEKFARSGIAVTKASMLDIQTRCNAAMSLPWSKYKSLSLKRAADALLGCTIDKKCATSDWSTERLSTEQVRYAALDAWVALRLYYCTC